MKRSAPTAPETGIIVTALLVMSSIRLLGLLVNGELDACCFEDVRQAHDVLRHLNNQTQWNTISKALGEPLSFCKA